VLGSSWTRDLYDESEKPDVRLGISFTLNTLHPWLGLLYGFSVSEDLVSSYRFEVEDNTITVNEGSFTLRPFIGRRFGSLILIASFDNYIQFVFDRGLKPIAYVPALGLCVSKQYPIGRDRTSAAGYPRRI